MGSISGYHKYLHFFIIKNFDSYKKLQQISVKENQSRKFENEFLVTVFTTSSSKPWLGTIKILYRTYKSTSYNKIIHNNIITRYEPHIQHTEHAYNKVSVVPFSSEMLDKLYAMSTIHCSTHTLINLFSDTFYIYNTILVFLFLFSVKVSTKRNYGKFINL